jgi:hypothetical protein
MLEVRKIKVVETLEHIFVEGEIFYEFFDCPDHFYKENDIKEVINLKTICEYSKFDMWFEEMKPVEKEETPQYKLLINK